MKNRKITKRFWAAILAAGISAIMLTGCGASSSVEGDLKDKEQMADDNSQPVDSAVESFGLKDYEGLYYKTETEEIEDYVVTYTYGYQLNGDGTGVCYGQDVVDFTWNETEIHFADSTENYVMEPGSLIVGDIAYDKMQGNFIAPCLPEINPENVEDGYYQVEIDKNGINEAEGQITIKAEVYAEDTFDIVDINNVAEGDVIYLKGGLVPVNSIQWVDSECVDINGGADNDGITLSTSERHPDYFRYIGQYEMDRSYSHIETINLKVSDEVKLTDSRDPAENKEYTGADAILALKEIVEEEPLFYDAGAVLIENGVIVEIYRNYIS